jgi:hypothetical protein
LLQILRTHLHINQERFASPLNRCPAIPTCYTAHTADRTFGALYDAYSTAWTGSSQANPEYEHADMDKAVRWAVHSAKQSSTPTLCTLILPHWGDKGNTAYLKYIQEFPQHCHLLARVPKKCTKFSTPDAFTGTACTASHPHWDVNILLVGNPAGYQLYYPNSRDDRDELMSQLITLLHMSPIEADTNINVEPKT